MNKDLNFSNEDKLILFCSSCFLSEDRIHLIKAIMRSELNWQYIIKKADFNRVIPFLYRSLKALSLEGRIPPEIRAQLKENYLNLTITNMHCYGELKRVLKSFNCSEIAPMLIKGASLWGTVYKDNPTLRQMGDIDILVKKDDWMRSVRIVEGLGYTLQQNKYIDLPNLHPVPVDYHMVFVSKNSIIVELKYCIWGLDFPDFETEEVWEMADKIKIGENEVLAPCPEYLILIACMGLVDHNFRELIWLCDINEVVSQYEKELDWQKLIRITMEKTMAVPVFYGLSFAAYLLGSKIPDGVLLNLKPTFFRRKIFELLCDKKAVLRFKSGGAHLLMIPFEIKMSVFAGKVRFSIKGISSVIKYCLKAAFPPLSFLAYRYSLPLNSKGLPIYYLLRLVKIFGFTVKAVMSGLALMVKNILLLAANLLPRRQ